MHESNGFVAALCGAASAVMLAISPALADDPDFQALCKVSKANRPAPYAWFLDPVVEQ